MAELWVAVTPRAGRDAVGPFVEGELRVRVTRPPTDGEANKGVVRLVARALDVPPSSVMIVAGEKSRKKRLRFEGIDDDELARRLRALPAD